MPVTRAFSSMCGGALEWVDLGGGEFLLPAAPGTELSLRRGVQYRLARGRGLRCFGFHSGPDADFVEAHYTPWVGAATLRCLEEDELLPVAGGQGGVTCGRCGAVCGAGRAATAGRSATPPLSRARCEKFQLIHPDVAYVIVFRSVYTVFGVQDPRENVFAKLPPGAGGRHLEHPPEWDEVVAGILDRVFCGAGGAAAAGTAGGGCDDLFAAEHGSTAAIQSRSSHSGEDTSRSARCAQPALSENGRRRSLTDTPIGAATAGTGVEGGGLEAVRRDSGGGGGSDATAAAAAAAAAGAPPPASGEGAAAPPPASGGACAASGSLRALVVGEQGVGKSTFLCYLANSLLSVLASVALLDTDLGQPLLTAPGVLSLQLLSAPLLGAPPAFVGPAGRSRAVEILQICIGALSPANDARAVAAAVGCLFAAYSQLVGGALERGVEAVAGGGGAGGAGISAGGTGDGSRLLSPVARPSRLLRATGFVPRTFVFGDGRDDARTYRLLAALKGFAADAGGGRGGRGGDGGGEGAAIRLATAAAAAAGAGDAGSRAAGWGEGALAEGGPKAAPAPAPAAAVRASGGAGGAAFGAAATASGAGTAFGAAATASGAGGTAQLVLTLMRAAAQSLPAFAPSIAQLVPPAPPALSPPVPLLVNICGWQTSTGWQLQRAIASLVWATHIFNLVEFAADGEGGFQSPFALTAPPGAVLVERACTGVNAPMLDLLQLFAADLSLVAANAEWQMRTLNVPCVRGTVRDPAAGDALPPPRCATHFMRFAAALRPALRLALAPALFSAEEFFSTGTGPVPSLVRCPALWDAEALATVSFRLDPAVIRIALTGMNAWDLALLDESAAALLLQRQLIFLCVADPADFAAADQAAYAGGLRRSLFVEARPWRGVGYAWCAGVAAAETSGPPARKSSYRAIVRVPRCANYRLVRSANVFFVPRNLNFDPAEARVARAPAVAAGGERARVRPTAPPALEVL